MRNYVGARKEKMDSDARDMHETLDWLKEKLGEEVSSEKSLILYGSETGNA